MKYLVTATPKGVPIPPDQAADLFQVAKDWMNTRINDGTIDCSYVFLGGGGFSISNGDTHEEVYSGLTSYPMYPFFSWEVKALCDWEYTFNLTIERYKEAAS